jgi:hypothetical protein
MFAEASVALAYEEGTPSQGSEQPRQGELKAHYLTPERLSDLSMSFFLGPN